MLTRLHTQKKLQLVIGLAIGIVFGFLLHKGRVTDYDVIMGQLFLKDFTVVKVMMSAVITGMVCIYVLRALGVVQLHPKKGSWGASAVGGIIFGAGFAILGYCPGTAAGAVGHGAIDALVGIAGLVAGSMLFAALYDRLKGGVLNWGDFGDVTIPRLLRVNAFVVVLPFAVMLVLFLYALERAGL